MEESRKTGEGTAGIKLPKKNKLVNELTFSISRYETFKYCARKYYFSYYESWDGWNNDAAQRKRLAYFLKKRDSAESWVGKVVHRAIRYTIANIQNIHKDYIIQKTRERIAYDFQLSLRGDYHTKPKLFGLIEHYKGDTLDMLFLANKAASLVETFFNSEFYHLLTEQPSLQLLYLDSENIQEMQFEFNGIKMFAIPDLCFKDQTDSYTLVDWKTGQANSDEISSQLKMYGLRLFAKHALDPETSQISAYNYFLSEGRKSGRSLNNYDLKEVRSVVTEGYSEMQGMLSDIPTNTPREEEHFAMTTSDVKCAKCEFNKLCFP